MWRFACPPCCFGPHVEVLDDSMLIAEDSSSRPWGVSASKSRMAPKKYNIHQLHKCLCSDGLPRHQPKILLCEVHVFMSQRVIYNTYHITMIKIQQVMKLPIKTKNICIKNHENSSPLQGSVSPLRGSVLLGSGVELRRPLRQLLATSVAKKKAPFLGNRMPIANGFAYRFGWIDMNLYVSQVEVYLPPTKHANCK